MKRIIVSFYPNNDIDFNFLETTLQDEIDIEEGELDLFEDFIEPEFGHNMVVNQVFEINKHNLKKVEDLLQKMKEEI